jgi:SAM-dependent methyltransferase
MTVMTTSARRPGLDLFLVSLLLLFLELACIRWFSSHVLFLTFFTNTVLLACFVGMSVGCLAASRPRNYLAATPGLLLLALAAGLGVELLRKALQPHLDVGNTASPQMIFFGTEHAGGDVARFAVPIEVLGGFFFLVVALALIGPGQELGRALGRVPGRLRAYTLNILGSLCGIGLFAACAWLELPPPAWFVPIALGVAYFRVRQGAVPVKRRRVEWACLAAAVLVASATSGPYLRGGPAAGQHLWSPYYRIDYDAPARLIDTNLVSHQQMVSRTTDRPAYAIPHLLRRDTGGAPFKEVLVIGAGSGNDVSRALQWGAEHVDTVEIDPVIQRLGARDHPDRPYQDPRVTVHLDDGRNFLRSTTKQYDLVLYALIDSLVLHSSYSNIRLESYLFTDEALRDVQRCLKPGGWFVMSNYYRMGWLVSRLKDSLKKRFGSEPVVLTLPYRPEVRPDDERSDGFTLFVAGHPGAVDGLTATFQRRPEYWLQGEPAETVLATAEERTEPFFGPATPDGFTQRPLADERGRSDWYQVGPARVLEAAEPIRTATDDWPFLYLRRPMIPDLSWRGTALMGGLALILLVAFRPRRSSPLSPCGRGEVMRMFFLGAGFMLIETKAVVQMALLFGSTWMVNTVVFAAVLGMILLANLFVGLVKPQRLGWSYVCLFAALAANFLVPLDAFLGASRWVQVTGAALLVFAPVACAGVVFAVSFARSRQPDRAVGANVAGAVLGGLAENCSMLLGFRYLVLVAAAFYAASSLAGGARHTIQTAGPADLNRDDDTPARPAA